MGTISEKLAYLTESKEQVRQAIEEMGVRIPSNTPFRQFAGKIGKITGDATATAADIMEGKTAYVQGVKLTGTMKNKNVVVFEALESESRQADGNYAVFNIGTGYENYNVYAAVTRMYGSIDAGGFTLNRVKYSSNGKVTLSFQWHNKQEVMLNGAAATIVLVEK